MVFLAVRPAAGGVLCPVHGQVSTAPLVLRARCWSRTARSEPQLSSASWTRLQKPPGRGRAQHLRATVTEPECIFQFDSPIHEHLSIVEFPEDFETPELAGSRVLFLDHSGNVHSIYREGKPLTGLYWDTLATVAGIAPEGIIGILGLGAGSVCQVIHHIWPDRLMQGWDIDMATIFVASRFMGLGTLIDCGSVIAHVGDALGDKAIVEGGFAALIVDIFAENAMIPAMTEDATWVKLRERLQPDGLVMINLGELPADAGQEHPSNLALQAMSKAFDGKVLLRQEKSEKSSNYIALAWQSGQSVSWDSIPSELQKCTDNWNPLAAN